jgi:hypothetical protein
MGFFDFMKSKNDEKDKAPRGELLVSSEVISADGTPLTPGPDQMPVNWDNALVIKWNGAMPKLTDRLFIGMGVAAYVNWAFQDLSGSDHHGFSKIEGPFGGRFIEVCKQLDHTTPSESASPASLKADIYFLSLSGTYNLRFGLGDVRVIEPALPDHPGVPTHIRGEYLVAIQSADEFLKLNRLQNFKLEMLLSKIKSAVEAVVVRAVSRATLELGVPMSQINTITIELSKRVQSLAGDELRETFGIALRKVNISAIEIALDSPEYATVFELLGSKGEATAKLKADSEVDRLRARLNAEGSIDDLELERKVNLADIASKIEGAKAEDLLKDTLHSLSQKDSVRDHENDLDSLRRQLDLSKEQQSAMSELELLRAQLSGNNRAQIAGIDQQAELAELKAKLESMKANDIVDDAAADLAKKKKERDHAELMDDLRKQFEAAELTQILEVQSRKYQVESEAILNDLAAVQRSAQFDEVKHGALVHQLMVDARKYEGNAMLELAKGQREVEVTMDDLANLKSREREIYEFRSKLEAQSEFADAHKTNIAAQLGELEARLKLQAFEADRLRIVHSLQGQKAKPVLDKPANAVDRPPHSTGSVGAEGRNTDSSGKSSKAASSSEVYTVTSGDRDLTMNLTIEQIVQVIRSGGLQYIQKVRPSEPTSALNTRLPDQQTNQEEI